MAKRILLVTVGLLFLALARAESVLVRWTFSDGLPDATATANANEKSFGSGNTFQNAPFYFARLAGSAGTGASFAGDVGETIVYDYAGARSTVSTRGRSSAAGRSSRTKDSGRRFRRWARGTWTESPRSVRRRWS